MPRKSLQSVCALYLTIISVSVNLIAIVGDAAPMVFVVFGDPVPVLLDGGQMFFFFGHFSSLCVLRLF